MPRETLLLPICSSTFHLTKRIHVKFMHQTHMDQRQVLNIGLHLQMPHFGAANWALKMSWNECVRILLHRSNSIIPVRSSSAIIMQCSCCLWGCLITQPTIYTSPETILWLNAFIIWAPFVKGRMSFSGTKNRYADSVLKTYWCSKFYVAAGPLTP